MWILKKLLLVVAGLVGLLGLLLLAGWILTLIPRTPQVYAYFLPDSEFYSLEFKTTNFRLPETGGSKGWEAIESNRQAFPFQFHWLKAGSGISFAVRIFTPSPFNVTDRERTEKITVWIPKIEMRKFVFTEPNAAAFRSKESSIWMGKGCGGAAKDGFLEITKVEGDSVTGRIKGQFECIGTTSTIDPALVDQEFTFHKKKIGEITPWIGRPFKEGDKDHNYFFSSMFPDK